MLVVVAVCCSAMLVPAGAGTRTTECQVGPPKTASPTGSRLWTVEHNGTFSALPQYVNPNGSIWLKAPWFAAGPRDRPKQGPRGVLHITGARLDRADTPLRATTRQVWVDGFGGSGVWAVVLTFPSEGCWSVKGRVNRTTHAFRLLVTKAQP